MMVIGTDGFGLGFREDDRDDRYHERGVSMRIYECVKKSSVIFSNVYEIKYIYIFKNYVSVEFFLRRTKDRFQLQRPKDFIAME